MFTRKSFLALATVTTIAAAAFAPTSASARGFGGFGGGFHFGGGGGGGFHFGGAQLGGARFGGARFAAAQRLGGLSRFSGAPHLGGNRLQLAGNRWDHGMHHEHWRDFGWHRLHWGLIDDVAFVPGDPGDAPALAPATQASAANAPCTCLTKRYLDDGSVLFTDTCTKEEALATPEELKAQAKGDYSSTQ